MEGVAWCCLFGKIDMRLMSVTKRMADVASCIPCYKRPSEKWMILPFICFMESHTCGLSCIILSLDLKWTDVNFCSEVDCCRQHGVIDVRPELYGILIHLRMETLPVITKAVL